MFFFMCFIYTVLPFLCLFNMFVSLSCLMNRYHKYEFKAIRWSLAMFVLTESLDIIGLIVRLATELSSVGWLIWTIHVYAGGYVMIQSIGIILVKKTRDPLERISKIGYLQLISSNQHNNEQFMTNIYENTEWKALNQNQQTDIVNLFTNKSIKQDSNSNTSSIHTSENLYPKSNYNYDDESQLYNLDHLTKSADLSRTNSSGVGFKIDETIKEWNE